MLNKDVYFEQATEDVVVMPLPDGKADVWIRRGIGSDEFDSFEEGEEIVVQHIAKEEAYARLDASEVSVKDIKKSLNKWFERVAAWEPPTPSGQSPQENEAFLVMRQQVESLASKVGELTQQNEALTECLLEMSEEVYG